MCNATGANISKSNLTARQHHAKISIGLLLSLEYLSSHIHFIYSNIGRLAKLIHSFNQSIIYLLIIVNIIQKIHGRKVTGKNANDIQYKQLGVYT